MNLETGEIVKEGPSPGAVIGMGTDYNLACLLMIMEGKEGLFILNAGTLKKSLPHIKTDMIPSGIATNPSTHIALLTNRVDNSISVISLEEKLILDTISFPGQPYAVSIDTKRNVALIAHKDGIAVVKLENPIPIIDSLIPESSKAGEPGVTLSIKGSKLMGESRARFDQNELSTLFEDNYNLKAIVPSEELLYPRNVPVTVSNPSPGGGLSNSLIFKVINPVPWVESITPSIVALNRPPAAIRVRGKNFLSNSTINLNGKNLKTRFISSILLEADLDLTSIKIPAKYPVIVINPVPVSLTSNIAFLDVVADVSLLPFSQKEEASKYEDKLPNPTGTLTGRILNTQKDPIAGVIVQIKSIRAETDSRGYFTLSGVPSGRQHVMIHGSTAIEPDSHYPTIPLSIDIAEGTITEMPFQIYLHRQKNYNFKDINPAEDTILTDPEVPGFEMRIPKGVNITGWDGKRNVKVSVRTVPTDRLPVKPLPDHAFVRTVYMFYFDKIGGGTPDQPIPIKSPNDLNLLPGEKAVLWYYDESPNEGEAPNDWAIAGTGTVTEDGMYIASDPGVGIPKFCCGATAWGGPGTDPPSGKDRCGKGGDPVDLATGYFIHSKTDLHIDGIIPVNITRYHRSGDIKRGTFGRGTYFEYDWWLGDYGDMLKLVKPGNYQYSFVKQNGQNVTYINTTDPEFRGAVVTYNSTDDTRTLNMRDGTKYTFTYKDRYSGELTSIEDRNGNKLTFSRLSRPPTGDDYGGYLTKITTAEGRTITFGLSLTQVGGIYKTTQITDDTGRVVRYTYEPDPFSQYTRLKTVTYPDGSIMEYQYDELGRLKGFINERGYLEVSNTYDASNRVLTQTHIDNGTYTFNYTVAGGYITQTSMTSPSGGVTSWAFNSSGYITSITTPDGTTTYELEAGTNLKNSVTDPLGRTTTYTYYSTHDVTDGLIESVTDPLGNVTSYEYETRYGMPTKITDALGKMTTFTYTFDSNNKLIMTEIRDPLLKLTTINYNTFGMQTSITDPNINTATFLYENVNRPAELTKIIDPLNNTVEMAYDNLGRLESITDAAGKTTSYTYDTMDRISSVTDPLDELTAYSYDNKGNLTKVADARNKEINYEYDERDRIIKMTDQLGRYETFGYDTSDNLITYTSRRGPVTTYSYDLMNRVQRISYQDGSYTDYTYDSAGRVDYVNDSLYGYIDWTWNDFGCTSCSGRGIDRLAQERTALGTIDYTYDADGRRSSMTVAGQQTVNYEYYDNGWPKEIRQIINGIERKFHFDYDDGGRRTALQYFRASSPVMETTYGYDTANRLLNMQHLQSTNILENLLYEYDANGNKTKFTRNAGQILRNDSSSPSCATKTYTFDARNRLVGISGFDNQCAPLSASFSYDALGRRIEKTVNGVTTQYVYDRMDIIQEIQGGVTTNYVRTLNIDEPLTRIKADGTIRHYKSDALGSIIALTDDAGNVTTIYAYDPFGNTTVSGDNSDNPFQYTGRENDGTGLYYYRARYYSPELQRFISEDPIGLAGGDINYFTYVWNTPCAWSDPLGLDPKEYPILRCHVNPHNDPIENAIGASLLFGAAGAAVLGPRVVATGASVISVGERLFYRYGDKLIPWMDFVKNQIEDYAQGKPGIEDLLVPAWEKYKDATKNNSCPADYNKTFECHRGY
jgi:RHS repeat-associated protein